MRTFISLSVLLGSLPAAAQPVTSPDACTATIARAPDDVREVVEAWVKAEPHCNVALEVRIVPTDGGLYLFARDERGRVRERIVPDAQSAAVLVTSWMADDSKPPPVEPVLVVPPASPVAPAPASTPAVIGSETYAPPGLAPVIAAPKAAPAAPRFSKWLTLGAFVPMEEYATRGFRGELDLVLRGKWALGAAASIGGGQMGMFNGYHFGTMSVVDVKAVGYITRTSRWGKWQLRPSLGLGFISTSGEAEMLDETNDWTTYRAQGVFATAEASLVVDRAIGKSWAIHAGPVATLLDQEFTNGMSGDYLFMSRADVDLVLFAGVRHRL